MQKIYIVDWNRKKNLLVSKRYFATNTDQLYEIEKRSIQAFVAAIWLK